MRNALRHMMDLILKAAFGTDERCKQESHMMRKPVKDASPAHHATDVMAAHAERKIDSLNAVTERLSRLNEAANLGQALEQLTNSGD